MKLSLQPSVLLALAATCASLVGAPVFAAPVPPKLADVLEPLPPSAVKLGGFLGQRVQNSEKNRLLVVDEDDLLAGFRKRPGRQAWIGEHVGKFLHAASLAWANTGDPKLRQKIDRVVSELIKTQEADGYLGTYTQDKRFGLYSGADWDVWVHKYNLIGLLTYHEYTGNPAALESSRKIGDLLLNTFGPGKKSINAAGTHMGMAATSVLEPIVNLYRATGDGRYLEFAKYIVGAWDEPGGPKILKSLNETGKVNKTANAKAYEMLSNLVGLCELARASGDKTLLIPVEKAWADITANQLYVTGTSSHHEHFHADHELPNDNNANVGETCVTTTWIQLNWQLLRLTGAAKYGHEIERSYYNQLAGAQLPDGSKWCYYTPLEGTKPYGNSTNCCLSSGPRAMALAPEMVFFKKTDAKGNQVLVVNLQESAQATVQLGGKPVVVTQTVSEQAGAPKKVALAFGVDGKARFEVQTRFPMTAAWGGRSGVTGVGAGGQFSAKVGEGWSTYAQRDWKNKSTLNQIWNPRALAITDEKSNAGRMTLTHGSFVLAYDEMLNPGLPSAKSVTLAPSAKAKPLGNGKYQASIQIGKEGPFKNAVFVPFAEAGASGGRVAVWLRAPGNFPLGDAAGEEMRSRAGNAGGSILDGDVATYAVTFDASKQDQDWFAVAFDKPMSVGRVSFAHGHTFHDGGWFDASAGKPLVQVQRALNGAWETLGSLEDYPNTTATDDRGLKDGQLFTMKLATPVLAVAVRVLGKPASGDNANQAFSSCAELSVAAQ